MPLRFALSETDSQSYSRRIELLTLCKLNTTADFLLTPGKALPNRLKRWARIMHADAYELGRITKPSDLDTPLSERTESAVYSALISSLTNIRSKFEHEVEEDEVMLQQGHYRAMPTPSPSAEPGSSEPRPKNPRQTILTTAPVGRAGGLLSPRGVLAVRNRRLSKLVLDDGLTRLAHEVEEAETARR